MSTERDTSVEELTLALEEARREIEETRAQLLQQNKMASIGTLVSGVAHDINTPLGSIKANGELAKTLAERIRKRAPEGDSKLIRSLDALDQSMSTLGLATERIRSIVSSLRSFAREDGNELTEANLHEGLDSSLLLVGHMFEGRIDARKRYGNLPLVRCRPGQLNQVFMNLLTNAVQAIEDKGTIDVKTSTSEDGSWVDIAISDTGVGIPEENVKKLFQTGFTTKGKSTGTGLGLAITCRLVQGHGGRITVDSELGVGTCFTVRIPVGGPPQGPPPDSDDD